MKFIKHLFVILALGCAAITAPVFAGDKDPLFINLTTDDSHRATMGIGFGVKQMERGHPLTIFLNDKGVFIGAKANAAKYAEHQKMLAEVMAKGATVLICPMCSKHYGVDTKDVLPGIKVGSPELTGGALFKDNTKSLTW